MVHLYIVTESNTSSPELYGLEGNEIQNMISLGDKLGLSRERIRQLKVKVFKKFGILRKRNIPAIIEIDNY